MVEIYLFFFTLFVAVTFIVINMTRANALANYLDYKGGALQLYNVTQGHVMSSGRLDFQLHDQQAEKMFAVLKRSIIIQYSVMIPLFFVNLIIAMVFGGA